MSLFHILTTARGGLLASQMGVQIAGHNIANAATEGYSRQHVNLKSAPALKTLNGWLGNGVMIDGWDRVRSSLADATLRREVAVREEFNQKISTLQQLESAMSEMSSAGVTEAMNQFFDAWSELATNPSGPAQRELVRQRANVLVQRVNNIDSRTDDIMVEVRQTIEADLVKLNGLSREVARLNEAIVTAEAGGKSAPDLRDARDRAIDSIAALVQVRAIEQRDGSVTLVSGNWVLADRGGSSELAVVSTATGYEVQDAASGQPVTIRGGRIGGSLDLVNIEIPAFRAAMDQVIEALVTEVNAIHSAGVTLGGATGINFFDPAGTTAGSFQVDAAILASRDNVIAGYTGDAGDGNAANDLERLRYNGLPVFGGDTILDAQLSVAVDLGLAIDNAKDVVATQESLVQELTMQRDSVSGVSTEEEMVKIMQFQHAYTAAARVITTADQMIQTLLDM